MQGPFQPVAPVEAIPPGRFVAVTVAGIPLLVANVDGTFYAVADLCTHEDYPLSYGCLDGDRIKCSLHGSRFCLRTGQPQEEPAVDPVATFRVAVEQGQVWVDPSRPRN
ncbi:MAG TPA: non-heme iron oxygenase ferredoxin subunit [Gammaproteobacteria bacterium]